MAFRSSCEIIFAATIWSSFIQVVFCLPCTCLSGRCFYTVDEEVKHGAITYCDSDQLGKSSYKCASYPTVWKYVTPPLGEEMALVELTAPADNVICIYPIATTMISAIWSKGITVFFHIVFLKRRNPSHYCQCLTCAAHSITESLLWINPNMHLEV